MCSVSIHSQSKNNILKSNLSSTNFCEESAKHSLISDAYNYSANSVNLNLEVIYLK